MEGSDAILRADWLDVRLLEGWYSGKNGFSAGHIVVQLREEVRWFH
jgi:hypothetical protein